MTNSELRQWREKLGISQEQASIALGLSRPTIARYEADSDIPKVVELACSYLSFFHAYEKLVNDQNDYRQHSGIHENLKKVVEQLLGIKNHEISLPFRSVIASSLENWLYSHR